jgi:hypothetical protein
MALGHLRQLLGFFEAATKYAKPDEGIEEADPEAAHSVAFHRRIVVASLAFGLIGAGGGVAFLFASGGQAIEKEGINVLLAPLMFAAAGMIFGAACALLFVPRSFLTGPAGQKWMTLVGTQNVLIIRIVCSIFVLLLMMVMALIGWAVWADAQQRPL